MPSPRYLHRDEALYLLGCMPARMPNEGDKSFQSRKALAASQCEKDYGITPHYVEKKRARRYREDEVMAVQKRIIKTAA